MPAVWLLVDLLTKKITLRCMHPFRYITSLTVRIRIRPYPYQSEKSDPVPYQNWSGSAATDKSLVPWAGRTFNIYPLGPLLILKGLSRDEMSGK
jgi:hypothetical protein